MMKWICSVAGVTLLLAGAPANAAPLLFSITGTDNLSFVLDSNPQPAFSGLLFSNPDIYTSEFVMVPGQYNGSSTTFNSLFFYDASSGGGLDLRLGSTLLLSLAGDPVFSGSLSNPAFSTGSFTFTQDTARGAVNDRLVISDDTVPGAVPEPTTWAMMLLGFGAIGLAFRRRQTPHAATLA